MGWASGMRAGIDIGRAYNEGVERKRLEGIRTAAPETSQGYTAEQGQQLEAMASAINPETGRPYYNVQVGQGGNYTVTPDFTEAQTPMAMGADSQYGVAPVELQTTGLGRAGVAAQPIPFNQQRVTDFLGRRFEGELTPDRIEAMRSRAMAEGLSDPRQRQAALAEATRAEREAEEAPLRQEALRTQVEAGKLGLKKAGFELTAAERAAADAQKMDDFSAWRSQNPQADFAAMSTKAQELGMSTDAQFKIASNLTGIKEQEFKASQQRIQELVKDQGLDGLLKAHKESKDLDPNSHFEVTRGQGGRITLNRVNTATGEIVQPNVFSGSEAETTAYLNKQATNPATVIDFTMNLEKNKAAIRASDRSGIRAPDINEYVDAQGNVRLIDVGALPRGKDGQPVLPQGLRKLPTGSASPKDLTPQQQRAFDALKGTDAFKTAVERGDQTSIRKLLTANAIPPEAFYGAAAAPPGGGDWTATPPPAAPAADKRPQPAVSRGEQQPSAGALRALRERSVGVLTPRGQLEAAAAAGNPAAIQELERRTANESAAAERNSQMTREQMRGLQ